MKIPGKIAILLLMLFNAVMVFAESASTPPPPSTAKGAAVAAGPPPTPEVPINGDFLYGLITAGLLLGICVIYKHKLKIKASV
ncbi:hypothetical protein [Flavobacterium ajazii]|uniref:hypothetical protein n=1 Tax=Flavobacterium ajazii TaxID=2692318 RepID=UPI0013D0885A|nr:hypothetical protein [Flavobacterium ajazii]